MIALWLAAGLAAAEPCVVEPERDTVAVAWVSPLRRRVGGGATLDVVPVVELREWLSLPERRTVGELLAALGLRKKPSDPGRRYKVTVFEVAPPLLCRPIEGATEGEWVAGVPTCPDARSRLVTDGAGCVTPAGLQAYRIRWREAAARGFCVLPADRFVAEAAR